MKMVRNVSFDTPESTQPQFSGLDPNQQAIRDLMNSKLQSRAMEPKPIGTWAGVAAQTLQGVHGAMERGRTQNELAQGRQAASDYYGSVLPDASPEMMTAGGYDSSIFENELALKRGLEEEDRLFARQKGLASYKNSLAKQLLAQTGGGFTGPLGKGQIKQDQVAGESIADWRSGGAERFSTNITRLGNVINEIDANPEGNYSGLMAGNVMEWGGGTGRSLMDDAAWAKQQVGAVVQQLLRETLGGQFAYKEGEALLERAWDPYLSTEDNVASVKILMEDMVRRKQRMDELSQYMDVNQTARGFRHDPSAQPAVSPTTGSKSIQDYSDDELRAIAGQ